MKNFAAAVLFGVMIILFSGQTVMYNIEIWKAIQSLTTPIHQANVVAEEIYVYLTNSSLSTEPLIAGFTKEENSHMRDVKKVIDGLNISLFLSCIIFLLLFLGGREKSSILLLGSSGVVIVLLVLLLIPFQSVFVMFHQAFFPAGSWTFSGGIMISAFPSDFFYWMAQIWWMRSFTSALIIAGISFFADHKHACSTTTMFI